jgi:hypothetical protein
MKRNYTLLLFLFATVSILAQTPEKMSYQAVLRDASNTLLTNQEVGIQISILQTTITGTAVYIETQTATTNINGLVSLAIGSGTSSDDFNTIDWSAGPYFIKTETDPTGGSSYSIAGASQIMSVPFAMYAKTSGSSEKNTTNIDNNTAAIALNIAKVGYTDALVSANTDVAANTVKVGYTEALVSANTDVAANTVKVGYTEALVSANTDVAANTVKVGYTEALVSANTDVAANTVKVGYTEALVSANTDVAANTVKVGYTEALVSANTDVAANTVKVGYTEALVSANTDVAANTVKVGYTEALVSANTDVAANTSKTGITTEQSDAIVANTVKTGITSVQSDAILVNTAKVGITAAQLDAILVNTAKVGVSAAQSDAIVTNTAKVGYTEALVSANTDVAANTAKIGITTEQSDAINTNTIAITETVMTTGDQSIDGAKTFTTSIIGNLTGDITGNVLNSLGTVILNQGNEDAEYTGNVKGQILSDNGTVVLNNGDAGGVSAQFTGDVTGNVTGGLTGDVTGDVTGNVTGDVTGNVTGGLTGDVTGNVTGDVTGNVTGGLTGNVTGDVTGNLTGDVTGNVTSNILKLNTLTQTEIDAITPEEGMVLYNQSKKKIQIYSTSSTSISNVEFTGQFTPDDHFPFVEGYQSFIAPFTGTIYGISLYLKKKENECCAVRLHFGGNISQIYEYENVYRDASENTPFWYEFTFATPINVTYGQSYSFNVDSGIFDLGVNFAYSNGEFNINTPNDFASGIDLMFTMNYTVDPNTPATLTWIDLN